MSYQIRDIDTRSIAAVVAMNERALPHVNSVSSEYFRAQLDNERYFRAVYHEDRPAAFLLAMTEAAEYDSLNFLWFRGRYSRFVYIDRIVVAEGYRRAGLAASLYGDLGQWAAGRTPRLACEVNLRPPNDASLRFHEAQGFLPVGTQETDGGRKTVSLMVKELVTDG